MFNDVGHLIETDKPTKAPWPALCAGSHSAQERLARTTGGADKDGILAKTAKGIVSFLQNLLSPLTRKEGVRCGQVSRLATIFQTAGISTIYGLLFAGLLLMPFQSQRATAAPPAEDTVETQELTLVGVLIGIGISITAMALWKGGEWVIEEIKTPNGTLVADTDIAVESLDGATSSWYVGRGPLSGERNSFQNGNTTRIMPPTRN